jgi:hypothetical protein
LTSSSLLEALLGEQRPRLESRPDAVGSFGQLAVDFVSAAGMRLEDWQEYVLWAWHDVDSDGNWAATESGLLVSRQNGKSEDLIAYDLVRLFLFPLPDKRRRTVLHTAHEVKTATESFEKLAAIIASSDRLMSRVQHIYTANGREAIVLKPREGQLLGDRVRFVARSRKSGRGFGASDIVYDESQELSTQSRSALTYTQSTILNRQEIFTGTVPAPEDDSEVWEGVRNRGRAGKSLRSCWQEWSPKGAEDPELAPTIDVNDPQVWREGIPALGLWIHPQTVAEQVERATDNEELLRERFSVWPNRAEVTVEALSELNIEAWGDSAGNYPITGKVAGSTISIAVSKGGTSATVAAGRRVPTGIAVEHKKTARGVLWVAEYVKKLKAELGNATVVLDAKLGASVVSALDREGVKYLAMNLDEIGAAHALFIEHVNAGLVPHRNQPEVTESLKFAAVRKFMRGGATWDQSDPKKPVTQAQAVTWALWGVLKAEATPKKRTPPPPAARVIQRDQKSRDDVDLATFQF